MIIIDTYTGSFDYQIRPVVTFRSGNLVAIHDSPDGREFDAYRRRLREAGFQDEEFVRYMPRRRLNVFRIRRKK